MMYSDKFVICIKVNGKVLRETKDLVKLPFGSEFSVLVKNLNSRRAKFKLHIDGQDVLDGTEIIVNANSEVELKRFIRNGNMTEGNAFKFIERTQKIEDGPRGIKVDDGVVRVEFWFEKEAPIVNHVYTHYHPTWYYYPYYGYPIHYYNNGFPYTYTTTTSGSTVYGQGVGISSGTTTGLGSSILATAQNSATGQASINSATVSAFTLQTGEQLCSTPIGDSVNAHNSAEPVNDVGITVPGSKVEQTFTTTYGFNPEDVSHTIILRLAGFVGETKVVAPITVKTKNICTTCRHVNKHSSKFCVECGTSLTLI